MRALPPGQTQRSDGAGGDEGAPLIAAPNRAQLGGESNLLACSEIDGMCTRLCAGARRPCVADLSAKAPAAGVLDHQHRVDGLAQPRGGLAESAAGQPAWAGRE